MVVNWSDAKEIAKDSGKPFNASMVPHLSLQRLDVFLKLTFSLFGVYIWEFFVTWDFEWSLLIKRRKFRWPLVCISVFNVAG
jgi:hypothetical protein